MNEARAPDKELIRKEYETGKYSFKQLADKFNISQGTIKSWAKRDKDNGQPWEKSKPQKVATKKEKVATKNKVENNDKEPIAEEVKEVLENIELTDKQRLFCIYYIKYFNATKAAIKAGYSKDTSYIIGFENLRKPNIKAEIERLKQNKLNRAMLSPDDIFQKYMDIAFSDITDYVEFGQEEVPVMTMYGPLKDKETDAIITKMVNTVKFKESVDIDGTIISEVKQGRDGASIKLQDKMKALEWLADHVDLATEEQKARIEVLKSKIPGKDKLNIQGQINTLADLIKSPQEREPLKDE
ncbi:MAG: DUF1804 family protein [Bacillota bacterium]|nr:DUF1804 family protein [Bacillota bacterium]